MNTEPSIEDVIIAHSEGDGEEGFLHNVIMYLADGKLAPEAVPYVCQRARVEGVIEPDSARNVLRGALSVVEAYGLR